VLDSVSRLAPRNNTVLITGESGVGKELVALGLHRFSSRNKGPLVCVNCATLNNTLADAELFGHAQGAYTGADQSGMGYFQQADDGTLFLDEVGELTPDVQAKLLRVLETGKFRPVRGKEISVDVRVVAATNRDLEKEVEEGRFRKDLYYRLANIQIEVPPLRERMADIPKLVEHFLKMFAIQYHKPVSITREAMDKLSRYHWPGNIRQLKSVLESSLNRSAGSIIEETDIEVPRERREGPDLPGVMSLEELEAWGIERALESTDWNQTQAAAVLGIHRETLMTKMRKYGLRKK
jgi:DNA-binding NtrC family response regulator